MKDLPTITPLYLTLSPEERITFICARNEARLSKKKRPPKTKTSRLTLAAFCAANGLSEAAVKSALLSHPEWSKLLFSNDTQLEGKDT